jgi:ribonucleoside-diphosphate reductase alpha chain
MKSKPFTPKLTQNAMVVLKRRYLKKDPDGKVIETPIEMFHRVSQNIASAETMYDAKADRALWEKIYYDLMAHLDFLPNSPTLMNAGRESQQLSACFVLPVEDSLESIFEAVKHTALIHQSGGGTGFSFSRLRPKNDRVLSTSGIASGPVSFMKVFNTATEVIKQGGTRRGANMAVLKVDHPDILEFIKAKENPSELTNFNISVGLTEAFMKAVESNTTYFLINPRNREVVQKLRARAVFDRIVEAAWKSGEPGILFLDRINQDQPTPKLGSIEATNPCGEQPLLPYESCNLGSINLARMVMEKEGSVALDYGKLERTIRVAVRFLDNIIDLNRYPLPQIDTITKGNRKIGLGVMGWADLLIQMGLPYDTPEALALADEVMGFIEGKARETSEALAKERGAFPNFHGSIFDRPSGKHLRNATVTTIAPTGTLSIIAGCSGGIEPLYGVCYLRTTLDGVQLIESHPTFLKLARRKKFYSRDLMRRLTDAESIQDITIIPKEIRRLFVTAHDIPPEAHVRMQVAFQRHTDNAVSKTVNFPPEATKQQVRKVFLLAHREGLKGITIYRSGSRDQQVLTCANIQYC